MSDFMYKWVVRIGYHAFWVSARPVVLHRERVADQAGAYILAPNHLSPYDVPCLMAEMPRWKLLDFVSITELFQNRLSAWFLRSVNAFPLDRHRTDSPTVRIILERLAKGRIIAMFPEGGFRSTANSVLSGGDVKPGVAKLAQLARVPVLPCVILGTKAYSKPHSWLPLRRVRYGINYGRPMYVRTDLDEAAARAEFLRELKRAYRSLHEELLGEMGPEQRREWQAASAAHEGVEQGDPMCAFVPSPGVPGEGGQASQGTRAIALGSRDGGVGRNGSGRKVVPLDEN